MTDWYLIFDREPQPGSWNMAVDEFLFRQARDTGQTFLRFYTWLKPTASLGCGQEVSRVLNLKECQKRGVEVVRRMTGGKVVLHHREVTYSVASARSDIFTSTLEGSYRLISEALVLGLQLMGLPAELAASTPAGYARSNLPCFAYPARNEVEVRGKKAIGSAQKRSGEAFIQHGSIPLVKEVELLAAISFGLVEGQEAAMTSLSDELGRQVGYLEAVEYLIEGFRQKFKITTENYLFSPEEVDIIRKIERQKYASWNWTGHKLDPGEV